MKKIAILIDNFGYGGIQKIGFYLSSYLSDDNYLVYLYALEDNDSVHKTKDNVILKTLGFARKNSKIEKLIEISKTSNKLKENLKLNSITKIIVLGDFTLLVAYLASINYKNLKIIGSERNSPNKYTKSWRKIMNYLFARCDKVIFQTEEAQKCYPEKIVKKSKVIPNPYFGSNNIKSTEANYISTAAARFEYKKGIDILIKAYNIFVKIHPEINLIIVGDGKEKNKYLNLIKKYGIENKVTFTGIVPSVVDEIIDSMFFVLPSRFEGIPNVLMEVMGAGIPVIASNCHPGGPKMLTKNGECGLLFETENYIELADKMIYLTENKCERDIISKKEMNRMKDFDPKNVYILWKDIIE